jgi:hypothetical protein
MVKALLTLLLDSNYFSIIKNRPPGHHKCREVWPVEPLQYEKIFGLFLDLILLLLPLAILAAAYFLISRTLWQSMGTEKQLVKQTTGRTGF